MITPISMISSLGGFQSPLSLVPQRSKFHTGDVRTVEIFVCPAETDILTDNVLVSLVVAQHVLLVPCRVRLIGILLVLVLGSLAENHCLLAVAK